LPDGRALLIVSVGKVSGGKAFVIEEGSAEAPLQATLHQWLVALVVGLAVLISSAVLGGFVVVQRALRPVDGIIQSAERISSQSLSHRLPVPDTGDELNRLSIALNNMIRRLEEAFQHTKRFLADASHELRTPLTMLQAELEAFIERSTGNDRETAISALEEVERLRKIVEGLFALSRLDAGEALEQSAPFDLGELAASTTDQMSLLAEDKQIELICHPAGKVIVHGDRSRLKQVIVNLLDNAIKYTPSGGRVDVHVKTRDSKAVLEVSDNGIGIPPEALPCVFDRFFRVDKARSRELGGAGLGLSIVKSICAAHNGRVQVESKSGQGTRFIVELPLRDRGCNE
jgi:heavy metal sensor kinase